MTTETPTSTSDRLVFEYRNYRGEVSIRQVQPMRVYFGNTEWHPESQWLLEAADLEKNAVRDFAMKDILRVF